MKKTRMLHISKGHKGIALPLSYVTSTAAILGKRRTGKSYKGSVIAEELLEASQQIVVLDPTSAWWGLRSMANGKSAGYPVTIFGGEHGDLPLSPDGGAELARAIVHERFSAIIDFDGLSMGKQKRFSVDFLETLYQVKRGIYRTPMHVMIDEADIFAPQRPLGDDARLLGACETMVRRGGIKGIGCTLITQRPAAISKGVLSQVDTLIALQLTHRADMDQIETWVGVHGDPAVSDEMMVQLPVLARGEAWVWCPSRDIFGLTVFRDRHTFDSGRTPEVGDHIPPPKVMAKVDLEALGSALAASVEEAKQTDPKHLRAEIARLKLELSKAPSTSTTDRSMDIRRVGDAVRAQLASANEQIAELKRRKPITDAQAKKVIGAAKHLGAILRSTSEAIDVHRHHVDTTIASFAKWNSEIADPVVVPSRAPATATDDLVGRTSPFNRPIPKKPLAAVATRREPPAERDDSELTAAVKRLLDTIALMETLGIETTRDRIAAWYGMHPNSKGFGNYMSKLRSAGLLEGWALTELGRSTATKIPTPTRAEVRERLLAPLEPRVRQVAEHIIRCDHLTRDELAKEVGMHANSKGLGNYVSKLRSRGLVTSTWPIRVTSVFEGGA